MLQKLSYKRDKFRQHGMDAAEDAQSAKRVNQTNLQVLSEKAPTPTTALSHFKTRNLLKTCLLWGLQISTKLETKVSFILLPVYHDVSTDSLRKKLN